MILLGRHVRIIAASALAAAVAVGVGSCSAPAAYLAVASGNAAYDRGHYEQATVEYLGAAKHELHLRWISYDLGNVYHALGEPAGAIEEWTKAEGSADPRLRAAASFNLGILEYELGHYSAAYERFRLVLELYPADMNAKINLELAYQRMKAQERPVANNPSNQRVGIEYNRAAVDSLMNLIREKQGSYWVSPKPERNQPRGPDY